MYSDKIVAATIRDFTLRNGWEPQMHSVGECDHMVEEIAKYADMSQSKTGARSYFFWKDDKSPSPATVKKIKRWIANERFFCFASAEYFVTRYAFIRAANTQIVHFDFRLAQKNLSRVPCRVRRPPDSDSAFHFEGAAVGRLDRHGSVLPASDSLRRQHLRDCGVGAG